METMVKGESSLYLIEQDDETTYKPATGGDQAIQPEADSVEFTLTRETIERNVWTDTIETVEGRTGKETVEGTVTLELKAANEAGAPPRGSILWESLMGGTHQLAEEITTLAGHTSSMIYVSETDLPKFKVGSCILIKEPGKFEVRPIKDLVTDGTDHYIELGVDLENVPSDGVVIEKVTTYFHDRDSKAFSAEHYIGGEIKEKIAGIKSVSASLESWSAEQTPKMAFTLSGVSLDREVGSPDPGIRPDFSEDTLPPVLRGACAWLGQKHLSYSEFTLSIENTSAELPDACSRSGKLGSRKTAFNVTASINPYMESDNVDRFTDFKLEEKTSLFIFASSPTAVEGEFKEVVAFWLPNVKITNMPTGDIEDVLIETLELQAFRSKGNDTIFASFI